VFDWRSGKMPKQLLGGKLPVLPGLEVPEFQGAVGDSLELRDLVSRKEFCILHPHGRKRKI